MSNGDRRSFLKKAGAAAFLAGSSPALLADEPSQSSRAENAAPTKPNIVLYIADEVRADCIGPSRANYMVKTPNLDKLAQRGAMFTHAVTNQPLCSPSRSCLFTGRYATETGVWKLLEDRSALPGGRGQTGVWNPETAGMRRDLPTLATELRSHGYTANLVGKWHLAKSDVNTATGFGWVAPEDRGGFLDFWEGANVLERTSHPYYGTIWDSAGHEITYKDEYRVDFLTDRAIRFLKQPQTKPFLLYISQLEPHFQNDLHTVVGPKGMADNYQNPYTPADLTALPGVWQHELPDYYAAIERIDQSVGRVMQTLEEQGMLDNTIFIFTSDHGCHFMTRENNYKRTPHDSSIRVPLVMAGPRIPEARRIDAIAGNINLMPTVLGLCGLTAPQSMKGRSMVAMIQTPGGESAWDNRELIQFSQGNGDSIGRAIRTPQWTYSIANPTGGSESPYAESYSEYVMFDNASDPAQLVSLCGRVGYKAQTNELRRQLLELIAFSGDPTPEILPARLLYP